MNETATATKATILFVDDEPRILTSMRMLFRGKYNALFATSGQEALARLKQEQVDVIVSDQRMPNMTGIELFREVRKFNDKSMRILLTGYSDLNAIISSINEGEIFRFVNKPWNNDELKETVAQAVAAAQHSGANTVEAEADFEPEPGTQYLDETSPSVAQCASPQPNAEGVLVLDDDRTMAPKIQEILGPQFHVHNAGSLAIAVTALENHDIAIVISETRVENVPITSLLNTLKQQQPELVSIILTERADAGSAIDLINQGQIFRLILKPIHESQCRIAVKSALRQNQKLLRNPELQKRYEVAQPVEPPPQVMAGGLLDRIRMLRSRLRAGV